MASRILLISINTYTTPDPVFPLGMAMLASALRAAGHKVFWQDDLASPRPVEEAIRAAEPDFVGISVRNIDDVLIRKRQTFFNKLPGLCARIRGVTSCPIVLGGSGFSVFPRELIEVSGADYGIQGEGEAAMLALLNALESHRDPGNVRGLVCRSGPNICLNPAAQSGAASPLDSDTDAATAFYVQKAGMLNVQTQRGCAHRCCYCTYPLIEGRSHRRRSGHEVAEDFAWAARAGAKFVFVVDSVFNSSPAHVHEVCEALLRNKVRVPWGCFLRPQGLTMESFALMARSGLTQVEFGSDSFSDTVLEQSSKGLDFGDIKVSSDLAHQLNVDYCHFLISGAPGETWATVQEGFANSRKLDGGVIMAVAGMRIYPGTPLFDRAVREGVIKADQSLLEPCYYVAPGLTVDELFASIQSFARTAPNWIAADANLAYENLVKRLRSRGIVGPLWSYFAMIQRLMPAQLQK